MMTPKTAALGTAILGILLIVVFVFWDSLMGNPQERWGYLQTIGAGIGLTIMLAGLVMYQAINDRTRFRR
jgi:hypothetical protein